jgi:DNA polymerase III delta subunit
MAVPNPERELVRLRQSLAGGLPRALVVLGPSRFFRAAAFDLVLAAVPRDRELRVLDGEQETDGRELDDLLGAGLFTRGTVLAVRRAGSWLEAHGAALEARLPRIADGCALVLEAPKLDKRTRLGKALAGGAFEFRDLYAEPYDRTRNPAEAELVQWVQERARGLGVPLDAQAALLVVGAAGKEPAELLAELGRLRARLGPAARPRDAASVAGHLHASFESTPFELAEALLAGDRRRCERSLQAMFARGVKGRDGEAMDQGGLFPFVTSWLQTALSQTYEGRWLFDRGTPAADVPRALGVHVFQERLIEQVRRNDEPRLRRMLLDLLRAQRELRDTGEDHELLLARFLARCFAETP